VGKLFTTDATHLKVNLVSNLSVLAEYSADLDRALALWRRFARHETGWSDAFAKHHTYREGGLLIKAGRITEAEPLLAQAHDRAVASGDQFHALAIALELGGLMLDHGDPDSAAKWYDTASGHAAEFGDSYHAALALSGKAVSAGELPAPEAERLAGRAADSVGYAGPAAELSRALSSGDTAEVGRLLPRPRTKLNRAFSPIRLEFEPQ
jgi:tetratricopeptide (TPR) repeat protein